MIFFLLLFIKIKKFFEEGSSINFNKALAEFEFNRSASSRIINLGKLFNVLVVNLCFKSLIISTLTVLFKLLPMYKKFSLTSKSILL